MKEREGAMRRILGQKNGRSLGFGGIKWSLWMLGRYRRREIFRVREGLVKNSAALELVLLPNKVELQSMSVGALRERG